MQNIEKHKVQKKVDYFGLMQKHKTKSSLLTIEESKKDMDSLQKSSKIVIETPAMKKRRAEINAVKAELSKLSGIEILETMPRKEVAVSRKDITRREELVYGQKILADAVGRRVQ